MTIEVAHKSNQKTSTIMNQLKVGDIVRLKSEDGLVKMTVTLYRMEKNLIS